MGREERLSSGVSLAQGMLAGTVSQSLAARCEGSLVPLGCVTLVESLLERIRQGHFGFVWVACVKVFLSSLVKPLLQTTHTSCVPSLQCEQGALSKHRWVQAISHLGVHPPASAEQIDATTWNRSRNLGYWNLGMSLVSDISPCSAVNANSAQCLTHSRGKLECLGGLPYGGAYNIHRGVEPFQEFWFATHMSQIFRLCWFPSNPSQAWLPLRRAI